MRLWSILIVEWSLTPVNGSRNTQKTREEVLAMINTVVQGRIGAVMSRRADCRKNSVVVGVNARG